MADELTVRISYHARDRCREMGITTKVPKRIVRTPTLTRPDPRHNPDRRFIWSEVEPKYAVIVDVEVNPPMVCTVLYYTPDAPFVRPEARSG